MRSYGYYWRLSTIVGCCLYPILCVLIDGYEISLSKYFHTSVQPLYLLCNIATVYYFLQLKDWSIPGVLLLFLTIFSVDKYMMLHNIFAVAFFLSVFYALTRSKRYTYLKYIFMIGLVCCAYSLLLGEIICIFTASLHHYLFLLKFKTIKEYNERDRSK